MSSAQPLTVAPSSPENTSTVIPTPAALLDAARKLAPTVRDAADETEKIRELPTRIYEAIADAGLFLMSAPRDVGGYEIDLPTHVRIIEEIAKADASTAWAINQGATFAWYSSRMKASAAHKVWGDVPRAVVANTPAPTAKAIVVPGGFRVTGKQSFSTGSRYAPWIAAHAQIIENGEVRKYHGPNGATSHNETRYLFVPRAEVTLHDTWHTRGMRGTGTQTFEVKDVFVPEERSVFSSGLNSPQLCGGIRYKIPLSLNFCSADGVVALAIARSCMTAILELSGAKAPRHMPGLLRDQAITQYAIGECEGQLRAARAFLYEAVDELWEETVRNGEPSMDKRVHTRLASIHGIRTAAQIVERLYPLAGGDSIFEGSAIQRYFQDIHVITQHVQGRLLNFELVGKYKLGLVTEDHRI